MEKPVADPGIYPDAPAFHAVVHCRRDGQDETILYHSDVCIGQTYERYGSGFVGQVRDGKYRIPAGGIDLLAKHHGVDRWIAADLCLDIYRLANAAATKEIQAGI